MTKNIVFLDLYRATGLIREYDAEEAMGMFGYVSAVLEMYEQRKFEYSRQLEFDGFEDEDYEAGVEYEIIIEWGSNDTSDEDA